MLVLNHTRHSLQTDDLKKTFLCTREATALGHANAPLRPVSSAIF